MKRSASPANAETTNPLNSAVPSTRKGTPNWLWPAIACVLLLILYLKPPSDESENAVYMISGVHEQDTMPRVLQHASAMLKSRVCGQPAVDGYAHVNPTCLENSPTNSWHKRYEAAGGRHEDLVAHIEERADYDGLAVRWGINHKTESVEECAEACRNHKPNPLGSGPFDALPCNVFVWCGGAEECFEPDAHHHTLQDCWLKFTEAPASPEVNMRGRLSEDYLKRHPNAPEEVPWSAGVLLPPGLQLTNGTWGVRWYW